MANELAIAFRSAGAAAGASAADLNNQADRSARRAAAKLEKAQREEQLRILNATKPTQDELDAQSDLQQIQIQNMITQQQQLQSQLQEKSSYEAFRLYDADGGDARHLNTMLDNMRASGSTIFGDVTRFDTISEADAELLELQNYDPQFILNDPDMRRNYVKATLSDGSQDIRSVDDFKGKTRYNKYATKEDIEQQQMNEMKRRVHALGYEPTAEGIEAFRRAAAEVPDTQSPEFQEAYTRHMEHIRTTGKSRGRTGSPNPNKTKDEREAARRTKLDGLNPGDEGYDAAFSQHMSNINSEYKRPSAIRNLEDAEQAETELMESGFWEAENTLDPQQRIKYENQIRRIESGYDAKLDTKQQATLSRVNELVNLGDIAKDITDEETGIIDRDWET